MLWFYESFFPVVWIFFVLYCSDAHGHEDVAVFVFVRVFGAHLAGGLGVLELEADFACCRAPSGSRACSWS
jgi:hypothetical protein